MRALLPWLTWGLGLWTTTTARRTEQLINLLQAFERAIPSNSVIEHYLLRANPDVLVVSPLVTNQSSQVDLLKSAQQVGIPTALCVASWDHLTTKGLMRIQPDLVAVWNHEQRQEAIDFHGTPADRIVITGAHSFDRWFDRVARRSRVDFCRRAGLDPSRPFVIFAGSTWSISSPKDRTRPRVRRHLPPRPEVEFVKRWIRAVRNGPGSLRDVGIMIRPHPYNTEQWREIDLTSYDDVVVYPRHGANPVDNDDRAEYYDTLHHGAAIVGINTSAMIEAAIQDRPVFTIVDSSFDDTQTGTLHFRYLLPENGGHLQRANSLDEHARQLATALNRNQAPSAQQFIKTFLRPQGVSSPSAPLLVAALEQLSVSNPARPPSVPLHLRLVGIWLWFLAALLALFNVHWLRRQFRRIGRRFNMSVRHLRKVTRKQSRKTALLLTSGFHQLGKPLRGTKGFKWFRRSLRRYAMGLWHLRKATDRKHQKLRKQLRRLAKRLRP